MIIDGIELANGSILTTVSGPIDLGAKLNTIASATGGAGLNVPHGTAPSSPENGDIWTTTTGLFVRLNGATVGPFVPTTGSVLSINGSTSLTLQGTSNAVLALTTSGFNADGNLDLDGATHDLNGTTSVTLVSSSASIAAIASGNEVDLTGTTIDINGNIDADGTTSNIAGTTSVTIQSSSASIAAIASGNEVDLTGTTIDINGAIDADGTTHDINGSTSVTLTGTANAILALTTSGFNIDGNIDADGTTHDINGTTSVTLTGGSAVATLSGTEIDLTATTLDFNGNADISGSLTVNNTLTVNAQAIVLNSTSGPFLRFTDGDATSGARNFRLRGNNTQFLMSTENDENTLVENFLRVTANSSSEVTLTELMGDEIDLTATTLDFNGAIDLDSSAGIIALDVGGGGVGISGSITSGTIALLINNALPRIALLESDAAADNQLWYVYASAERFNIAAVDDARSTVTSAFFIDRTGTTIDLVRIDATEFEVNGTMDLNGSIDADGTTHDINGTTSVTLTGTANAVLALTTSGFNMDGVLDLDGSGSHNLNGTTSVVLVSGSASLSVISSGAEVDLTGTTLDLNGNIDADGTTHDINGSTSVTLTGTANATLVLNTSGLALTGQTVVTHSGANPLQVSRSGSASNCSIQFTTTGGSMYAGIAATGVFAIDADNNINASPIASFSTSEVDLTATTIDINGAVDISGATVFGGLTRKSIAVDQTAAGTNQGNAHVITTEITHYATVASGTGAILPSSVGTCFIVMNTGANALNVYPASGDQIDSLGSNNPFVLPAGARIMFICTSSSQYRTLNATYA